MRRRKLVTCVKPRHNEDSKTSRRDASISSRSDTCNKTETVPNGYGPAVMHTLKVFGTAAATLERFLDSAGELFPSAEYGCSKLVRKGKKRNVHYLEVEDGSGPKLRIEVYVL